eukprot:1655587-Amphidinium_carterae.1
MFTYKADFHFYPSSYGDIIQPAALFSLPLNSAQQENIASVPKAKLCLCHGTTSFLALMSYTNQLEPKRMPWSSFAAESHFVPSLSAQVSEPRLRTTQKL